MLIPDETIKGLKTRKALISVRNIIEEEVTTKSSEATLATLVNLNKIMIEALFTPTSECDEDKGVDKEPVSGKVTRRFQVLGILTNFAGPLHWFL